VIVPFDNTWDAYVDRQIAVQCAQTTLSYIPLPLTAIDTVAETATKRTGGAITEPASTSRPASSR